MVSRGGKLQCTGHASVAVVEPWNERQSEIGSCRRFRTHPLHLSFQSAYLLAERGLLADARTVVRSAAETAIFIAALSQDPSVADILIARHFYHHRKLRAAWLADPQALAQMTQEQIEAVKRSIAEIDKEHPNLKRDPFVLANLATKGPFIALYNAVYRVASGDAAHVSIDALNRHIRADAQANILGLKFGPELEDLPDTLSIAISILGLALFSVVELFDVHQLDDELNQCMQAWKALGIPSEFTELKRPFSLPTRPAIAIDKPIAQEMMGLSLCH